MAKPTIAVFGGTGQQGGGVIDALLASGQFSVRIGTRNPGSDAAKALARRGVDVAKADLLDAASLHPLLEGAYGAFLVTNFWDPAQMHHETEIGTAAVRAARGAGVKHLVWSTLPDCERITGGRFKVAHYTDKARLGLKNGKLRGKDSFNVKENPYITFRSTKITQTGPLTFELDGDFTIRGVTKKEKLKLTDAGKGTPTGLFSGPL